MDKIVYTAIFGNYDDLKEPTIITPGWQYICYTDQPLTSPIWQVVHTPVPDWTTPQRYARWFKIMHWVDWQYSVWIDAAFQINVDLNDWWGRWFVLPFSCAKHPLRTCVYREIESCIVGNRGDVAELRKQQDDYKNEGVEPYNNRIITSGMLLRHNTTECIELCEKWWAEVAKYSTRDQVAFAKVSIGYRIHTFVWDYSQSRELKYIKHKQLRQ